MSLVSYVLPLSVHPFTVPKCVCMADTHAEKERDKKRDTGLSQTTSIMTLHEYFLS